MAKTFHQYPEVAKTFRDITNLSLACNFTHPDGGPKGRRYDAAVLFNLAGGEDFFKGKCVAELGARDGIFGSYLARHGSIVCTSDYFEEWGKGTDHDLGQIEYWKNIWEGAAGDDSRNQIASSEDILNLSYASNQFDCVVCASVIEHMFNQRRDKESDKPIGDMEALKELTRICKPGGLLLLSTDMIGGNQASVWHSGTYYYSQDDLKQRLLNAPGCKLHVPKDMPESSFNTEDPDNDAIGKHRTLEPVMPVVFALKATK
jgi:SAM-dependent methyltransferase